MQLLGSGYPVAAVDQYRLRDAGRAGKAKSHELLALADERMYRQKKVYRTDNPGILSSYVPMGAEDGGLVQ